MCTKHLSNNPLDAIASNRPPYFPLHTYTQPTPFQLIGQINHCAIKAAQPFSGTVNPIEFPTFSQKMCFREPIGLHGTLYS